MPRFRAATAVSSSLTPWFTGRAGAGKPYRVRWYTDDDIPFGITLRPHTPHGSVRVQWAALRDGWPAGAKPLPPRPANVMATGSSDATVITGETTLRW